MATVTKKATTKKTVNTQEIDALLLNEATQEKTVSDVFLLNGKPLHVESIKPNGDHGLTMRVTVHVIRQEEATRAYAIVFPQGVPCPFQATDIIPANTLLVRQGKKAGVAKFFTSDINRIQKMAQSLEEEGATFGHLHFLKQDETSIHDAEYREYGANTSALLNGEMTRKDYAASQKAVADRYAEQLASML